MNKGTSAHPDHSLNKNTNHTNLIELLRSRALHQSERLAYTFLADGETQEINVTYGELDRRARAIGSLLQKSGATGERVLLFYPPGLEFIYAFFGCLYAGAVAVPLYPPRMNRSLGRLQTVIEDAQAKFALATSSVQSRVELLFSEVPRLKSIAWMSTDNDAVGDDHLQDLDLTGDTLAFLQYTSGSTGAPKGVMISHGNLLHNSLLLSEVFGYNADSKCVSWLPVYHDMGLIGGVIQPLHGSFHCVLLSPAAFLQRPYRWLQAISRYRATISGGPNFAYDLSIQKITPQQRASLDLSSWEVAFNGSEPIQAKTLDRFSSYFEPRGFRREAFHPCYGLAEATLLVSGKSKGVAPVVRSVESESLGHNQFRVASDETESNKRLVGCGHTPASQKIAIVDPRTLTRCSPDQIGEIWVSSESVAKGYWNRADETDSTFRAKITGTGEGPYLRTGDLGILKDEELFVTGRLKDMMIIRGRNHYPQDIEFTVEQATRAVKPASGAAFSVEVDGEEQLVIVYELNGRNPQDLNGVVDAICRSIAQEHELQVYSAVLVKQATILKTSSGKIQRQACRNAFLAGTLEVMTKWRKPAGTKTEASVSPREASRESVEAVEEWLLSQLAARLGCGPGEIDAQQSIARYGIDSLASVDLAHGIETAFGINLSIVSLLESSSIAELAAQIYSQLTGPSSVAKSSVIPTLKTDITPGALSYNQQSLWFLQELEPTSSAYNIARASRIAGDLDSAALRASFQALTDRHASLRTTFDSVDGAPIQRVHEHAEVFFHDEDARGRSEESLSDRIIEEAFQPFDLEKGPLLRVMLFARSDREYILLLVIHHIIADYWSLGILLHELVIIYDAIKAGAEPLLPPLKLLYSDYARWQAAMLASPDGERMWSHWQKQLAGDIPALDLPTDRPRPPVQTYTGAYQSLKIDAETSLALQSFSQSHEATINMTLQAAFQVLLHRYSGQEDILVGTPTAGRTRADFAPLVGYFVNPVVLRADLSGNPRFDSFLSRTRRDMIAALEHQDYPFPLLVDKLHPQRDPGRSPLFQALFVMQKDRFLEEEGLAAFANGEAGARIHFSGFSMESLTLEQQIAQFDLTLFVAEIAGELKAAIEYNIDLFDRSTIERMLGHFHNLLKAIISDPSGRVSDLPLLTEAERHQMLVEWNSASTVFPEDQSIPDQFEAQVRRTPDAVAVIFRQQKLSYRELDARSNQLARYLISLGVEPDMRVGICVDRSIEMMTGLLGILKSGASYVPLDPAFPKDRLAFMLKDAQVKILLTQHHLLDLLPADAAKTILLDSDQEVIARASRTKPVSRVMPENLAYVIYTSGSTGQPKGVMLTHRSALNLFYAMDAHVVSDPPGVWMGLTSISFDISVVELLWTLARGFKVVLQDGDQPIAEQIREHKVSHFQCTPSMARILTLDPDSLDSMRLFDKMILGGEAVPPSLARQIKEVMPGELNNMYGPTENTVYSTSHSVNRFDNIIPIGRPLANNSAYILDSRLQPTPLGVVGDLYLSGNQIARGYLNRPDLTAERFIPDPFSRQPGERMYSTGDIARYLPDGTIEFRGRSDDQVKIHGYRIELAEIESLLSRHPSVRDVVVIATNDNFDDKILAAYIVPVEDQEPSTRDLRDYLGRQLPAYMIPSVFMLLDSIPLTGSGKVNRRLLPKPSAFGQDRQADFAKPQTPVEEVIAEIWAEILGGDQVSVRDSFFEMGGNSLSAARLVARLRQTFPVDIQLRNLFGAPTIENLAGVIEGLLMEKIEQMSDDEAERLA